ncbi:Ig-like domain-containing protein [Rhodoblastus sp.]|jgi:hypothetical protein|uniref:beta strand repeat-containing protein n=1 Tax=Rhodoblastus sp. TaxID=1962975 RepID=UPI0025D9F447|nr:Ig-like domain-containing protein [Rhodoblastus sp.]
MGSPGPVTTLHYAANGNFVNGVYAPGADGFNLADVGSADELKALPAGVKGLVWLGMTDGVTPAFIAAVTACIGNPNLYGFYLADEPDGSATIAANLKAEADYIKANAPGAVTYMTEQNLSGDTSPTFYYTPANTDIDLFGLDPYPVNTNVPNSLDYTIIPAAVAAAETAGIPLADIVPIYQAFGGGSYSTYILPTAEQEQQILATWASVVPNPSFDYAYSWGVQESDTALSNDPSLQAVFAIQNAGGSAPTPPAAPTITTPANGGTYATATPVIAGTGIAGDTVTISIDGAVAGSTVVAGSGSWSYTPTSPLSEGGHTITATQTDAAGVTSAPSAADGFIVDTLTTESAIADVAVTIGTDGKIYINSANFNGGSTILTGKAEAGDSVTVSVNGGAALTATVATDGNWSATLAGLTDGASYSAVATATDPAGHTAQSPVFTLTVDATSPAAPMFNAPTYAGTASSGHWNLSGVAETASTVKIYDRTQISSSNPSGLLATLLNSAANGAWSYLGLASNSKNSRSAAHDFYATSTDAAGNVGAPSGDYWIGTSGNDTFTFGSEPTLLNGGVWGNGGSDIIAFSAAATLTDADFANVRLGGLTLPSGATANSTKMTLTLSGASAVTLGTNASNAKISAIGVGNGNTSITDSNPGTLTVNGAALGSGKTLTLTGSGPVTVTGLTGNLDASGDSGALTITATGTTPQTVKTGSGAIAIADSAAGGGVTVDATALRSGTLTLSGSAAETVNNLVGNIAATALSGTLNVTTGATTALSIATGSGAATINASAMTSGETLTLTGSRAATVSVGGNLNAGADNGAITVVTTGTAGHTILTGGGKDTITASHGGDTIQAGGGGDSINVLGRSVNDVFIYSAVGDSLNTSSGHDTITGFLAAGDTVNFSGIDPSLTDVGLLGGAIAAHSFGWGYSGGSAKIYVNNTGGALSTSSTSLMEITLTGVSTGLSASNFVA